MRALATAAALAATLGLAPAEAAPPSYIATVNSVYVVGDVTVVQGGTLTLVNGETIAHDVLSTDYENGVPLFQSDVIAGTGTSAVVRGVEALSVGIWPFQCSLHEAMRGTVTVVAAP